MFYTFSPSNFTKLHLNICLQLLWIWPVPTFCDTVNSYSTKTENICTDKITLQPVPGDQSLEAICFLSSPSLHWLWNVYPRADPHFAISIPTSTNERSYNFL